MTIPAARKAQDGEIEVAARAERGIDIVHIGALQSWLERRILPRTELEPSLQQSIAAVFGYVGVIAAIVLALSQLGIDLQKVALTSNSMILVWLWI